jgi:hypothetical protein
MKKMLIVFYGSLLMGFSAFTQKTTKYFVSPSGKDTYAGTIEKPFATLNRARLAIRGAHKLNQQDSIIVYLRKGVYSLKTSFVLDSLDSGDDNAPVVYSAYANEEVRINGSISIPVKKAIKVSDANILSRFVPEAKDHILQVNLKSAGIHNYGEIKPRGFARPYEPAAMELFCNDEAMKLSRWPNDSTVKIGKVIDKGSVPRDGDTSNRGGKFSFNTSRPDRWANAKDIWISGFFRYGYADDAVKVASLDLANRTITTQQPHLYGFESGKVFNRFYAFNLLEEIDQPGEYYIDREKGILYFYPPSETIQSIALSILETPLLVLNNASHVIFRNIIFESSRGIGFYMERGTANRIEHCVFRNLGQVGIVLGKGIKSFDQLQHAGTGEPASQVIGSLYGHMYNHTTYERDAGVDHLINGCKIYNTGAGGIILGGGNRLTLQKGNNRVENCYIHDFNRLERSYRAGINIDGVGNVIRNNEIHNCPGSAILLHGNNHLIERNNIHHAVTDGDDMGAIYYGRDPSEFGNKVVNNFFHHIGNDHGLIVSVYHDDGACGMEVTGNIFYLAGSRSVLIGGGSHNVYRNNIFIESSTAIHLDNRLQHWAGNLIQRDGLFQQRLNAVNYQQPPYSTSYPALKNHFSDTVGLPKANFIESNLFVNVKMLHNGSAQWSNIGKNYFSFDESMFVEFSKMNFALKANADVFKKMPEFKAIPFEQIGVRN